MGPVPGREIGSEFQLRLEDLDAKSDSLLGDMARRRALLFDSGRSALRFALERMRPRSVLLPEYICESVIAPFDEVGAEVRYYRLGEGLAIDIDDLAAKAAGGADIVYLMHYFGAAQDRGLVSDVLGLRSELGFRIVEDVTHSLLGVAEPVGDVCYASLRKWGPLPDGGALLGADDGRWREDYDDLPREPAGAKAYGMVLKELYVRGMLDCNAEYRELFAASEGALDARAEPRRVSWLSERLMETMSLGAMRDARLRNLGRLESLIAGFGERVVAFGEGDVPLCLPLRVGDRDGLRTFLTGNRAYCAAHWPFYGGCPEDRATAADLARHEISLPLDQRYGADDVERIAALVLEYEGRGR